MLKDGNKNRTGLLILLGVTFALLVLGGVLLVRSNENLPPLRTGDGRQSCHHCRCKAPWTVSKDFGNGNCHSVQEGYNASADDECIAMCGPGSYCKQSTDGGASVCFGCDKPCSTAVTKLAKCKTGQTYCGDGKTMPTGMQGQCLQGDPFGPLSVVDCNPFIYRDSGCHIDSDCLGDNYCDRAVPNHASPDFPGTCRAKITCQPLGGIFDRANPHQGVCYNGGDPEP